MPHDSRGFPETFAKIKGFEWKIGRHEIQREKVSRKPSESVFGKKFRENSETAIFLKPKKSCFFKIMTI